MSRYRDVVTADLRLTVLHVLDASPAYRLAVPLLHQLLLANGAAVSEAGLRRELEWLQSAGLVLVELGYGGGAALTQAGQDCANGRSRIEGVRRLRPGEDAALRDA